MRRIGVILCVGMILMLAGCGRKDELEDKAFVLALGVDHTQEGLYVTYGFPKASDKGSDSGDSSDKTAGDLPETGITAASLYEAEKIYDLRSDKHLDYSHLKAIVLNRELFSDTKQLLELLEYFEKQEPFARSTKIFLGDETATKIVAGHEDAGGFLNNMYENGDYLTEEKAVTLQDLLNHWHNQDRVLMIPVVDVDGKQIAVTAYGICSRLAYIGELSVGESDVIFFARGVKAPFSFQTQEGNIIEVRNNRIESVFDREDTQVVYKLKLNGTARVVVGDTNSHDTVGQIEQSAVKQMETRIREIYGLWQQEYQVDLLDSYRIVGSRSRKIALDYRDRQQEYEKAIRLLPTVSLKFE